MADQIPLLSPTKNTPTNTISSLISPRFFNGILNKSLQDPETTTLISTKSILDAKNSSFPSANPFNYVRTPSKHQTINSCNNKIETEAIGLALIDSLNQEKNSQNSPKSINRMALFGSNLKVQIPPAATATTSPPVEAMKSPLDLGVKTRNLLGVSPETPTRVFSRQLSLKEMELSEDYTCVITHGPNPKTIHIFDDCIVEDCICEEVKISDDKKSESISDSLESFCHSCKDSSEKACCSHECQSEERDFEGRKSPDRDDALFLTREG